MYWMEQNCETMHWLILLADILTEQNQEKGEALLTAQYFVLLKHEVNTLLDYNESILNNSIILI